MISLEPEESKAPTVSQIFNLKTSGLFEKNATAYPMVMTMSSDKLRFVSGLSNNSVLLIDTEKLKPIATLLQAHEARINDLQITESISYSASNDGKITIWDTRKPEPTHRLKAPVGKELYSLAQVKNIIAGGSHKQIYFWDLKSLKKLNTFVGSHGDDVMKLNFHPSKNNMLLSGSIDGCVCLYDLKQGNEDDALETVINMEQPVISCNFLSGDIDLAHITTSISTLKVVSLKEAKELLDYNTIENIDTNTKYLINAYSTPKDTRLKYLCGYANSGTIDEIAIEWDMSGNQAADRITQFQTQHKGLITTAWKLKEDLLLSASEDCTFQISQGQVQPPRKKPNPDMIDIEEVSKDLFMEEEIPETRIKSTVDFMNSFNPF